MAADLVELAREIHLDPAEAIFQAAKITADVKHIFQTRDVKNTPSIFVAQRYQNFQLRA